MDNNILLVLKHLEPHGLAININISPCIDQIFTFDSSQNEYEFNWQRNQVVDFIQKLREAQLINIDPYQYDRICRFENRQGQNKWFGEFAFISSLAINGLAYLEKERAILREDTMAKSITDTNKSVIETNEIMGNHVQNQVDILRTQSRIFAATALFALLSVAISAYGIYSTSEEKELKSQLEQQSLRMQQLDKQNEQIKNTVLILRDSIELIHSHK